MKSRKLLAAALCVILCLAAVLSGCGKGPLAAKAGDREITVKQLENAYNNSASYASYYGYTLDTAEGVEAYQDYLLDSLLSEQVAAYEAELAGVKLSDEEQAEAEAAAKESYDSTYKTFTDQAEQSGTTDVTAYANKLFAETLAGNGLTVSSLKKQLLSDEVDSRIIEKHKTQLLADKQLTADELKAKYDEELASEKELFDATPSMYFTYESYASYGYTVSPVYVPDGFFRVRQILVEDEATATEVKKKIDAGEDFEALLAEYNTDPGMDSNKEGYLIGEGANYVEAFLNAAMALEQDGDVSEPVQSDYGYHIIKRVSTEQSHEIPYADVQETFDAFLQSSADTTAYQEILNGWMTDETLVTRYPENYRSIGKANLPETTPEPAATDEAAAETAAPEATEAPAQ